ncbi:MAG: hypothetical protein GF419_09370 [Ignavibacteriales bacterium]|nr:hypothetical protein [Ignavibacteriales bacterium]
MSKAMFVVNYEIDEAKREDYLASIKEYKSLIAADGLERYDVYALKGNPNAFREVFEFADRESFENFDDCDDERVNVLVTKMEGLKKPNTTKLETFFELDV